MPRDWVGRHVRPVFRNMEYGPHDGDPRRQFDVGSPFLTLLNPRLRDGTLHVAGNMNNMLCFDNLIAMSGCRYRALGVGTDAVAEYVEEAEPEPEAMGEGQEPLGEGQGPAHRLVAKRATVRRQASPPIWDVSEELYDLDRFGQNVVVQRRSMTISRAPDGAWEASIA